MRAVILAALGIAATILLAIGQTAAAGDADGCRLKPEEPRSYKDASSEAFAQGWNALARGDVAAARDHFDRSFAEDRTGVTASILGDFYRDGFCGLPRDAAKAATLYGVGANRGEGGAMLDLALLYWKGQGVPQDRRRAASLFRQGLIAFELLGGKDEIPELDGLVGGPVPPELLQEFEWVKHIADSAASARNAAQAAQISLDYLAACRYLTLAYHKHRDPEAAYQLGLMHIHGVGIRGSRAHGLAYLSRAATKRHAAATAEIGRMLVRQDIKPRTEWAGLAWLLRASNLGANVAKDVADAKNTLPPAEIKEAEMQSQFLPPLDIPDADGQRRCISEENHQQPAR